MFWFRSIIISGLFQAQLSPTVGGGGRGFFKMCLHSKYIENIGIKVAGKTPIVIIESIKNTHQYTQEHPKGFNLRVRTAVVADILDCKVKG